MKKYKIYLSSIIIFLSLFGIFTPNLANATDDFSGDWTGQWYSITNQRGGTYYLNLSQNGTSVTGAFTLIGGSCSPIDNIPVTGTVSGNLISYNGNYTCGGNSGSMEISQAAITNNTLAGNFTVYVNGTFYGQGTINLTRSINIINSTAGTGGTIIPAGNISVNAGSDKTFNIFPNDGYKIMDVIVDGVSVGANNSYTFNNVSANHTITATFKIKTNSMPWLQLLLE